MFVDKNQIENILRLSFEDGFSQLNLSYCDLKEIPFFLLERPLLIKNKKVDGNNEKDENYVNPKLSNIKELNLTNNYLSKVDSKIAKFEKVETLDVSINKIEQLPRQLCELGNLRKLIIHDNPLQKLPSKISSLQMLEVLDVSNTNIYEVPNALRHLHNLRTLKLTNCKISVLPKEIFYLPNIKSIDLEGNPLIDPPIEIAVKGIEAVKQYFKEIDSSIKKDYLYEIKLLLIGEERAGKSTIAEALSNPNFEFDLYKKSTHGIDIKKWIIPKDKLNINKDFQINIWDFGGQEIYHATHQFFLTKRSLYFLVTEARKDLRHDDLFYWLNLIEVLGNNSPVSILVNKSDQPYTFFATDSYREKFPNILDSKNISCLPDYKNTILDLKNSVYSILNNKKIMPDIGVELPKVWVDIRNELNIIRDTGAFYITTQRYYAICKKYEMNEGRALFLSDYFHDLGVFLHFQNDFILKDTIFLNFEWVTNAVYCVLDNPKIINNHGFFDYKDLDVLWNINDYNCKKNELLTLMKNEKFEVCFEIESGKYLAPQLLHPDKIPFNFENTDNVTTIEYLYEFMPKGIISRFIVKNHDLIYNNRYWKHGVILRYKDTTAIVEEKYFESPKKISIKLSGKEKKEMFSIIRKSIDDINNSFNNIVIHEMLQCNCAICRNHIKPNFYNLKELQNRLNNKRYKIECNNPPYEKISISLLINEIISDTLFSGTLSIPEDFEVFEKKNIAEKLHKTQEDLLSIKSELDKEKEKNESTKRLAKKIDELKIQVNKLDGQKEILDKKAIKRTKRISYYYFILNLCLLIFWSLLIYWFTWDAIEPFTYIFGLLIACVNSIYLIKRKINLSHKEIWESKLNTQMNIIYKENRFSMEEYACVKNEYTKLKSEYKELIK